MKTARTALGVLVLGMLCSFARIGRAAVETTAWPKVVEGSHGTVVVYQPQIESFQDDRITARAAVAVTPAEGGEALFAAVWLNARIVTDRRNRVVDLTDVSVTDVRSPEASEEQRAGLRRIIEDAARVWNLSMSLDQFLADVELLRKEQAVSDQIRSVPPQILIRKTPAVLVTMDGEPTLEEVSRTRLMRVVNTPFSMFLDTESRKYYLLAGGYWMQADDPLGPWRTTVRAPSAAVALAEGKSAAGLTGLKSVPAPRAGERVAEIIVATEPAELIVMDGEPQFRVIAGTSLLYVSNTGADLFLDINTQTIYLLASGRWFRASRTEGPWSYVEPERLPGDFARIPPGSAKGLVRAHVPGTLEAREAVADTQIPQTAVVRRSKAQLEVVYDGEPRFVVIENSPMAYAVNTSHAVIRVNERYYCCHDAVWFESANPRSGWTVCVSVPRVIYSLPPSCPLYPVRYVYVYHYTPEYVFVGYTPGYLGCYAYRGCVVYGTGYHYVPWRGRVYYPRPLTYGFYFSYFGSTGDWYVGVLLSGAWGWITAGELWPGVWWGPVARPVPVPAVPAPRPPVVRPVRPSGPHGSPNIYDRRTDTVAAAPPRPATGLAGTTGAVSPALRNDLFADRDGKVYRKGLDGWESPASENARGGGAAGKPGTRVTATLAAGSAAARTDAVTMPSPVPAETSREQISSPSRPSADSQTGPRQAPRDQGQPPVSPGQAAGGASGTVESPRRQAQEPALPEPPAGTSVEVGGMGNQVSGGRLEPQRQRELDGYLGARSRGRERAEQFQQSPSSAPAVSTDATGASRRETSPGTGRDDRANGADPRGTKR